MTANSILHPSHAQRGFFRAADAVSSLSNHNQSKLGCVLVDKHRIISSGHNSSARYSPLQKKMDVSRFGSPDQYKGLVHAETSCLLPLIRQGYDMSRSDLYIVRRHKNGSLSRFPDRAPDVCLFYGQTASGACFSASRAVMQSRE